MSKLNKCSDLKPICMNVVGQISCVKDIGSLSAPKHAENIALGIVNEILQNAVDTATKSSLTNLTGETENLRKTRTLSDDTSFLQEMADAEHEQLQNINLSEIVEGIHVNNRPTATTEDSVRIDIETKRFLSDIMSSPYDVNFESSPRKDGVGDQANDAEERNADEDSRTEYDNARIVEKKSRVTDLVMNSKQVLTEIFLSEEERKKQEEWEQSKESIIQVIDLQCVEASEVDALMKKVKLTSVESSSPEATQEEDDDNEEATFTPIPKDDMLELIDLSAEAFKEEEKKISCERDEHHGGKGDDLKSMQGVDMLPRSSKSLPSSSTQSKQNLDDSKKDKKKKWSFGVKILDFWKKHSHKRQTENATEAKEITDNVAENKGD